MDSMDDGSMRHMVQLNRRSRSETLCKVRYRIILGRQPADIGCLRSEIREEIFDFIGNGEAFYFTDDYFQYAHDGNRLQLTLELTSITGVNHMKLNVLSPDKRPVAQCFDRDRQTWCITTTPSSGEGRRRSRASLAGDLDNPDDNCLSFTLLYPDVQNIPRNYLRFVSWSFNIIPQHKKRDTPNDTQPTLNATALGAPFEHYYSQLETDNGFVMKTRLSLNEIREHAGKWLDDVGQRLTVQLEWLGSYLLLHPAYHAYDDIYRKHILQMRREVQALQAENNTLEKQVHDFQLTLSNKPSSGSDTPTRPRTASASSNLSASGSANLQPPTSTNNRNVPPPGSQLTPTQHRNSASSLEGTLSASSDGKRPARSISGIDVTFAGSDRPGTPRQRSGSGVEAPATRDYRNGSSQPHKLQDMRESASELRAEYTDEGHDFPCSPPTTPTRSRPAYLSPTKKSFRKTSGSDLTGPDSQAGTPSTIRRVASTRSASRPSHRRESPNRYEHYDDDDEFYDRSDYLSTDRAAYIDHYGAGGGGGGGGGALVRSKSASPYPQRHHPMHSANAYWRAETPTNARSDDDGRENVQKRTYASGIGAGQLKPELLRFGDDRSDSHHRNRSFRMHHHRERKMTSPRRSHHHGREAEDVADLNVSHENYYYR